MTPYQQDIHVVKGMAQNPAARRNTRNRCIPTLIPTSSKDNQLLTTTERYNLTSFFAETLWLIHA